MPEISELFPSKYLRGEDLQAKGPVTVEIAGIDTAEAYRPGEGKTKIYILRCIKASKGVVLSPPLARQIAGIVGSTNTDNWPGKRITLYPEPMVVAGRQRVAVRARQAESVPNNGSGAK